VAEFDSRDGAFRFLGFFGCVEAIFCSPWVVVEGTTAAIGPTLTACALFRGLFTAVKPVMVTGI
jgi:hypothetical protein